MGLYFILRFDYQTTKNTNTKVKHLSECFPRLCHQEVETVDSVAESPYIGKARHIRNTITSGPRNSSSSPSLQTQEGSDLHIDMGTSHPFLEDCKTEQSKGKDRMISALKTPLVFCGERKTAILQVSLVGALGGEETRC